MLKNDKPLKRYSEDFKLKVLSEIASGKYNKNEIQKVYGISTATIGDWLRKYNRLDLLASQVFTLLAPFSFHLCD
jgi:transposase